MLLNLLKNNFGLKVLAVCLAVTAWGYFHLAAAPGTTAKFDQTLAVPIVVTGLKTGYQARYADKVATVVIEVPRNGTAVKPDQVQAVLDVGDLVDPGFHNVPVKIVSPDVAIRSLSPASVTLSLDRLEERVVPVSVDYVGDRRAIVVDSPVVTPSTTTIRGVGTDLSRVTGVRVEIPIPSKPQLVRQHDSSDAVGRRRRGDRKRAGVAEPRPRARQFHLRDDPGEIGRVGKYFGTDGVRGVANGDLTPELAYAIGRAGAAVIGHAQSLDKPIVVGRDTRLSGPMLEGAIVAGITSTGRNVVLLGIVPTPAVAAITVSIEAAAGVMISASHNPIEDNGIKFFGADGFKLSDAVESEIERLIEDSAHLPRPTGLDIGIVAQTPGLLDSYFAKLVAAGADLTGRTIVIDGAFGAAYLVGPKIFERLGARVVAINCEDDGSRINVDCGATDLAHAARARARRDRALDRTGRRRRVRRRRRSGAVRRRDAVRCSAATT